MPITLRTGDIVRADPVKKLYKVVYSISPYKEEYAVPIDGLHTFPNSSGVVSCTSYAIGDHVLYVCPEDISMDNPLVWIVGRVPKDIPYTESREEDARWSLFPNTFHGLTADLYPIITDHLQDAGFLHGYNAVENFPVDITTGDYNVGGERTHINVNDYNMLLKAGVSEILLDSILGVITQNSSLYNRYTLGEATRTQYYRGILVHTKNLTGDIGQGTTPTADALFSYREQFSDLLFGHREEILDTQHRPILQVRKDLDGTFNLLAAGGIALHRTVGLRNYTLNVEESVYTGEELPPANKDNPLETIEGLPEWHGVSLIDGAESVMTQVLDMAEEGDWEANDSASSMTYKDTYTGADHRVILGDSGLDIRPDGSVIIRDAWGSEIRLSHGNVQISAANNLTTIAGRDQLAIVSGVSAINAGEGLEWGTANGDIAMHSTKALRMSSHEYINHSVDHKEYTEGNKLIKANRVYTDAVTAETHCDSVIVITAPTVQVAGTGRCLLTTDNCGITLASNYMTIGASVVNMHSSLYLKNGKYTIKGVAKEYYGCGNITIPSGSHNIIVGGHVMLDGTLVANAGIQTAGGVYANIMAAHSVTSYGGIYKLRREIEKQEELKNKEEEDTEVGMKKETFAYIKKLFTQDILTDAKRVFRKASMAFKIIAPRYRGKHCVIPASCSVGGGELSYIYPGADFWLKDGLVTVVQERTHITGTDTITVSGCSQLQLNKPNAKGEE